MRKIFICILFLFYLIHLAAEEKQYLSAVELTVDDSDEKVKYFYDISGNRVLQLNQLKQGSDYINTKYTEWLYSAGLCFSEVVKKWQYGQYVNQQKTDFEYNQNKITSKTVRNWINNEWTNSVSESYTYNDKQKIASYTQKYWQEGSWINVLKTEYVYADNKLTEITTFLWKNNQWELNYQVGFLYNTDDNCTETAFSYWNKEKSIWLPDEKILYHFNAENLPVIEEKQKWQEEKQEWSKQTRIEYEYDLAGNLLTQTNTYWDVCYWKNDSKIVMEYNGGQLVQKEISSWIYNMWLPAYMEKYAYDEYNNQTESESTELFWGTNIMDYYAKHLSIQYNNAEKRETFYADRVTATYKPLNDVIKEPDEEDQNVRVNIFPNPSSDGFYYIDTQNATVNNWQIFSLDGKMVKSADNAVNGYSSNVISIQEQNVGMYILKIVTDKGTFKEKLIRR